MTDKKETGDKAGGHKEAGAQDATGGQPGDYVVPVKVLAQYIKDLSFENPNAPNSLVNAWGMPQIQTQVNVRTKLLQETTYEVLLLFRIEATNAEKQKTVFIVELAYGATVSLHGVPDRMHQPVLMIDVPTLLFPYAREIISGAVMQGGYPALLLPPMDFRAIFSSEAVQKNLQEQRMKQQALSGSGKDGESEKKSGKTERAKA